MRATRADRACPMKIIIGTLAAIYALALVVRLVLMQTSDQVVGSSAYNAGATGGAIFGIILGSAIAIKCFSK